MAGSTPGAFAIYFSLTLAQQAGLLRWGLGARTIYEQERREDDGRQRQKGKTQTPHCAPLRLSAVARTVDEGLEQFHPLKIATGYL